jgi:hypothetical protein
MSDMSISALANFGGEQSLRYLNLLILVMILGVSWGLVHRTPTISQSVHVAIQKDLKRVIQEHLNKKLPTAKNINFERMWTETLGEGQVKAHFVYAFDDQNEKVGSTRMQIEGFAVLKHDNSDKHPDQDVWNFAQFTILNNSIEFKEPIVIKPAGDGN